MKAKVFKTGKIINVEYSTYSDYKPYIDIDNGDMYGDDEIRLIDDSTDKKNAPTQEEWYVFLDAVKEMRTIQRQREKNDFNFKKFSSITDWNDFMVESYERLKDLEHAIDNMIKNFLK